MLPTETLKASPAIDWVGRKEFDYTCKEVAEGRPLETVAGLSYRDPDGRIKHNPEREMIANMDALPAVYELMARCGIKWQLYCKLPTTAARHASLTTRNLRSISVPM